jgi:hypothetical protein
VTPYPGVIMKNIMQNITTPNTTKIKACLAVLITFSDFNNIKSKTTRKIGE